MRTFRIVMPHPFVNISLKFLDSLIQLLSECNLIKLVENSFVKPLADTVRLRRTRLCFGVVNIFDRQVKLILVMLPIAAVFRAAIGQDTKQANVFGFKKRQHFIIEDIRCDERVFPIVKFDECDSRISINKGLLVDSADTFQIADIKGILRSQIAGMFSFDLTVRLLFEFGFLKREDPSASVRIKPSRKQSSRQSH